LESTYGIKNLTFVVQPQAGSQINWVKDVQETQVILNTFTNFYIVNADNTFTLAFNAIINVAFNATLNIASDNTVSLNIEEMDLT
jgi:hypothetical protein